MIDLRRSQGDRLGIWVMAALTGFVPLLLAFGALAALAEGEGIGGGLLLVFALMMAPLSYLVVREAVARSTTRITIDAAVLRLNLPAQRSYAPLPALRETIDRKNIDSIETRTEAFRAAGNTVTQRAYALVLSGGRRIVLGADRRMADAYYEQAAHALSLALEKPIREIGTVDGDAGFLMFFGQSAPAWDASPLPAAAGEKRVRDEQTAWRFAWIVVAAAMLIAAVARLAGG